MKLTIGYRKKIILSQVAVFSFLILGSIPFVEIGLMGIQRHSFAKGAAKIIKEMLTSVKDDLEIGSFVRCLRGEIFYKVALYDATFSLIATSNVGILGDEPLFLQKAQSLIADANDKKGAVFAVIESSDEERFLCIATPFLYGGKKYILLGASPSGPIELFYESFNFWFSFICLAAIAVFSLFTFFVLKRMHRPISKMIAAITAARYGKKDAIEKLSYAKEISRDDDLGKLAQTLIAQDETVRKQMKKISQAKEEREAILEALCEGIVALDPSMRIDYINFMGAKMLGVAKKGAAGRQFDQSIDSRHALFVEKCIELLHAAKRYKKIITDSISLENSAKIYYDLIALPRSEDGSCILVIQDRSSQQKVLEMGKDFIANASHELRTPITIIKGFAETLQDMKQIPHDMLSSIVEKIMRNCDRMENLVTNLLTLADLENISISPYVSCDIILLIETCMDIVRAVYSDAHIELHSPARPVFVAGDDSILELAIINLLSNAAKYSKGPAEITVTVVILDAEVKISISDRGIGIPEADLDHIFERFYTVDKAHSRRLGGAGLGLSLVKTIVEKHHGTIEVSSRLGHGTTFTLLLPQPKGFLTA